MHPTCLELSLTPNNENTESAEVADTHIVSMITTINTKTNDMRMTIVRIITIRVIHIPIEYYKGEKHKITKYMIFWL